MRATLLFAVVAFSLSAFSLSAFSQITDVPGREVNTTKLTDSTYTWYLDISQDEWLLAVKMKNTYDSRGNLTKAAYWLAESPDVWINLYTFLYTYNEYDSLTISLLKAGGENYLMIENEYNPLGRKASQTMKEWDGMIWVTNSVQTYTYDTENKLLTLTNTQIPASLGYYYVFTYTYDDADYLVNMLNENYAQNVIFTKTQNIYENNSIGNRISDLSQEWLQNSWQNQMRKVYTYDGQQNLLTIDEFSWNNGSWANLRKTSHTYDDHNNLIGYIAYSWDGFDWKKQSAGRRTFDQDNFMTSEVNLNYDFDGAESFGDSTHYYPKEPLGVKEIAQSNPLHIWPNPGNGIFTLTGEMPLDAVEVYNLSGEQIRHITPTNRHNLQIDLTDQAKGVYVVKTKSADRVGVGKIVLK